MAQLADVTIVVEQPPLQKKGRLPFQCLLKSHLFSEAFSLTSYVDDLIFYLYFMVFVNHLVICYEKH